MTRAVCVIPARMGSSRYPGKPLERLLGLELILHVWHRCHLHPGFERVVVATCDQVIFDAVIKAGGQAVMTRDSHERCTDRVEEAILNLDLGLAEDDLVLMVQGDEILVSPEMVGAIHDDYLEHGAPVTNLASRITSAADHDDPNVVKVVASPAGRALYFSRAPIPSRARAATPPVWQQTGVIGFSAGFLRRFSSLEPTPLEKIESCDMMRVIEHDLPLRLVFTEVETIGVDTPADLRRAEEVLRNDPVTPRYLGP